ncbi:MAG: helix-turn-helix transcriptional regulator [Planctomycetaceae bacterium]
MIALNYYVDLHGGELPIAELDHEEHAVLERIQARAAENPDWAEFTNYWTAEIAALYERRGVSRAESADSPLYRIAEDLDSRLAIAQGLARAPDYRDELQKLIRERFKSQRAFCEATGISEDMLSHVLARRKHLAIDTLEKALARIGCTLRIVPTEPAAKK